MTRLPLPNPDLLAMSRRLSPFPIFFFFFLWCERAELFPFSGRPVSCFQHLFAYFGSRRWCCARLVEIDTVEVPRNVGKIFSHSPAGFRIRRIRVQSTLEYLCMYVSDARSKENRWSTTYDLLPQLKVYFGNVLAIS